MTASLSRLHSERKPPGSAMTMPESPGSSGIGAGWFSDAWQRWRSHSLPRPPTVTQ